MPITETTFIGITPTSGKSAFTYAVLDKDLRLLALADGDLDDLIAFVGAKFSYGSRQCACFGQSRCGA